MGGREETLGQAHEKPAEKLYWKLGSSAPNKQVEKHGMERSD